MHPCSTLHGQALAYCHGRRLLHRDLKPANVFMAKHHVVKLGDFGIAKQLSTNTNMAATVVGTPYYLSPEAGLGGAGRLKANTSKLVNQPKPCLKAPPGVKPRSREAMKEYDNNAPPPPPVLIRFERCAAKRTTHTTRDEG